MSLPIVPLTIDDLTKTTVDGNGAFDVLMRGSRAHMQQEYDSNRIKGQDYAQVYLGTLTAVLQNAVTYLLQKDEASQKALLIAEQIKLAVLQRELLSVQITNTTIEGENLLKQGCLLAAQYDLTMAQQLQTTAQTDLIMQKTATERAQTVATGVDDNSVVGRQKTLYKAQADGFLRDAEQKAAKLLVDSWNVRRTTDEGTVADANNMLNDVTIGRAINKMMSGVGA